MRQFRWYLAVSSVWALAQLFLPVELAGIWYLAGALAALIALWPKALKVPATVRTGAGGGDGTGNRRAASEEPRVG